MGLWLKRVRTTSVRLLVKEKIAESLCHCFYASILLKRAVTYICTMYMYIMKKRFGATALMIMHERASIWPWCHLYSGKIMWPLLRLALITANQQRLTCLLRPRNGHYLQFVEAETHLAIIERDSVFNRCK